MAGSGSGDGLMRWLLGGLALGFVLFVVVIGVGLVVGESSDDVASPPAETTPIETGPIETGPAGSGPAETTMTETTPGETAAEGDLVAQGKEVFASAGCGGCHALADAGSTGSVGPSLDGTGLAPELVADRVANGQGAMPPFAGQLSPEQIEAVAAYVAQASGG